MITLPPPLSLYVHMPWCVKKCPYCDFNSHQQNGDLPEFDYLACLEADLNADLKLISNRKLQTIFIGGGTPSLFSGVAIECLVKQIIGNSFDCGRDIEITMEANPGTVEQQRFIDYHNAGVNRLSLGVQSFNDEKLKSLGRIHNAAQSELAITALKKAGFKNFNIDIMFGLPAQTMDEALSDLKTAIRHSPQHISWYQLTLEPNTFFYRYPPSLPDDDQLMDIYLAGKKLLKTHGYNQYEVSAYARDGYQCQHNLNYWQFGDYLGIGAGAHGKLTEGNDIFRTRKVRQPKDYLDVDKKFMVEKNTLDDKTLIFEFMLNHLRLFQSVHADLFTARTGLDYSSLDKMLFKAEQDNFVSIKNKAQFEITAHGHQYLNNLIEIFLPV